MHREAAMIPYEAVTADADRRWTFRLLDRLTAHDLPAAERADLVAALEAVSDRRAVPILERLLVDASQRADVREAAGTILRGMEYLDADSPEATLRDWWAGSDPILRRHALLSVGSRQCPDVVRAAAADPTHPLRTTALRRMTFFFDTPADLRLKISTLADTDPAAREVAATILFYDEPVAAEELLVAAAADAVEGVAVEAAATLQYYPSVRVIRCLHELRNHPSNRVRWAAGESLDDIRSNGLLYVLDHDPRVSARVRRWLDPVWDLLAFTAEELSPPESERYIPPVTQRPRPPVLDDLRGLLADPDTSPKVLEELLWSAGWKQYAAADRRRLRPVLLNHPDPLVRERGTVPLQEWHDTAGLLALTCDPDFGVRKAAMYRLSLLLVDPRVAAVAWDHLHRPGVCGVHATETLGTFAAHADRGEAISKLALIAADPVWSENLRVAAVHDLAGLEAAAELERLAAVLAEPPAVTWALHIAVINALSDLGVDINVCHLSAVDNLHVQAAVAKTDGPCDL